MTLRSLITIDVDDSAFTSFRAKFKEFQDAARMSLGQAPMGGGSSHPSGTTMHEIDMGAAVVILTEIKDLVKKILEREKDSSSGGFGGGGEGGQGGVGGFLPFLRGGAGRLFLGAAAAAGVAAFAAYEGGKFILEGAGLSGTARDATAMRTAARGAGVSVGAYRAFQTDLAPYGDGEHLLQQVAGAQNDLRNPLNRALLSSGIGPGMSADIGAKAILGQLRDIGLASKSNPGLLVPTLQARQLSEVDPTGTFARGLAGLKKEEYDQLMKQLDLDSKANAVQDDTLKVWQDLNQTVARSNASLETAFLNTLPAAAKAETAEVELLSTKIRQAADEIDRRFPALTTGVKPATTVWDPTGQQAGGSAGGGGTAAGGGGTAAHGIGFWHWLTHIGSLNVGEDAALKQARLEQSQVTNAAIPTLTPTPPTAITPTGGDPYAFANIKDALAQTESNGGRHMLSPAGAIGRYQIMPGVGASYGFNRQQLAMEQNNAYVAEQEWSKARKRYPDPMQTAASYNWGGGNLHRDIAQFGSDWDKNLPNETHNYITTSALAQAIKQIANSKQQSVKVQVANGTGADPYVQTRLANR